MKRVVILSLVLLSAAFIAWSLDDIDSDEHSVNPEQVVEDILSQMGLSSPEAIDPDAVPEHLLERLGDAVMSEVHPDEQVHTWMDNMMGGEGSESLSSAHRWMGYRYLSDDSAYGYGRGHMGMKGPGMMGRGRGWNRNGSDFQSIPYNSPEEVLKQRYARGEINRQDYLQALEDLER